MLYKNLFILCVIAFVMLVNEINGQQRPQQAQRQQQIRRRPVRQQQPQQRPQAQQPQQQAQQRPQQPRQVAQQPTQQGQCSPRGGNCQKNGDCCSTSCLQQRCQRSVQEIQQEIALGYSGSNVPFWHIPGAKKYDNIDDLLGSIYEDGTNVENTRPVSGKNRPANNNIRPAFNNNRPIAVSNPNDFRQLNNNNRAGVNRNLPGLGNRIDNIDDNQSAGQQTSSQCFGIGAKCTRGIECCSNRCHGFAHQCVT